MIWLPSEPTTTAVAVVVLMRCSLDKRSQAPAYDGQEV
jgi:hypothetical protein